MTKRKRRVPGYNLHKPTGQAYVRLEGGGGPLTYLGEYGSAASKAEYERLIKLWHDENHSELNLRSVSVGYLIVNYLKHAQVHYVKHGEVTSEVSAIRSAMRKLKDRYGTLAAAEFSPKKLKQVREDMIKAGWVRSSINSQVSRINRMLKWAVAEELIPSSVFESCRTLDPLERGRTKAQESQKVTSVPVDRIEAIRPHVSRQIWAMVCLQLETGMRPQEVRLLRLADLDRTHKDLWEYLPARHKTQHHQKERRLFLNERAQKIVAPFLKADKEAYLFSPHDAFLEFQQSRTRETPVQPSQQNRRVAQPRKTAGDKYSKDSYNRAITRACEVAFEMPDGLTSEEKSAWRKENTWSPGQLRHNAATEFYREFDKDTARVILGHSTASTTEIYIDEDFEKARRAIRKRSG